MICKRKIKECCCEDPSLIENYEQAMADKTQTWDCHHRKEIELNKTAKELKEMGLYFNRPACELIFLTRNEHTRLHYKGKKRGQSPNKGKKRPNISIVLKGKPKPKYVWLTPSGETKIMSAQNAKRYHPDWVMIS